jgi:hypothetical protein
MKYPDGKAVIYDATNGNVWIDHGKFNKKKQLITTTIVNHGKDLRKVRSAAIQTGKKHGLRVYDRDYGKFIETKPKKKVSNSMVMYNPFAMMPFGKKGMRW